MRSISEILNDAADLLNADGWIQGTMSNLDGYCLVGALWQVGGADFPVTAALSLQEYLRLKVDDEYPTNIFDDGSLLVNWNDNTDRTKAEVIATLRTCAALERAKAELGDVGEWSASFMVAV